MSKMYNVKIYEATRLPIPESIIEKKDQGYGKQPLSYITGTVVTDYLNEIFDYCWSWQVTGQWIDNTFPFYKKDKQTKELTLVKKDLSHIIHVKGILTAPVINPFTGEHIMVQKEAFGSKIVYETDGEPGQESMYKSAATDALKKAASMFGIDGHLRRSEDEDTFKNNLHVEMYNDGKIWTPLSQSLHAFRMKKIVETQKASGKTAQDFIKDITGGKYTGIYPYNIEEVYQKVVGK